MPRLFLGRCFFGGGDTFGGGGFILVEVPGSFMVFKNQGGVGVGIFWKKSTLG